MSYALSGDSVIWEDRDFLVVAKPPGMETVSRDGGPELTALARESLAEPGLVPVHRLDRDTSGAQLFARNPAAEETLIALFRKRLVDKEYWAVCRGTPRNRTGVVRRNLSRWTGGRRPVRVMKQGGLEAATAYEVVAPAREFPGGLVAGVVSFRPLQGRTHQIRVHAASLGYPVLGDDQYGERPANKLARERLGIERQALHSLRLSFDWRGKRIAALCPPAADLRRAFDALHGKGDW